MRKFIVLISAAVLLQSCVVSTAAKVVKGVATVGYKAVKGTVKGISWTVSKAKGKIDEDRLLVFAGEQAAVAEWEGQAGADQRGADMGMAVVVVPGLLVLVADVVGNQPLESLLQVMLHQPRFVFQRGQRSGGSDGKQVDDPVAGHVAKLLGYLAGQVQNLAVAFCGKLELEALHDGGLR